MGKKRKQREHEQLEVVKGDQKIKKSVKVSPKRKKTSKNNILGCHEFESNEDSVAVAKKPQCMEVNVSTKIQNQISTALIDDNTQVKAIHNKSKKKKRKKQHVEQDEANKDTSNKGADIANVKQKSKKIKEDIASGVVNIEYTSAISTTSNNEKDETRLKRETVKKEVNCVESHQQNMNNSSKIKKKKNVIHNETENISEQNTDNNKEKPKKKKKRKIVEEEIVNDEEIDRYCDELDEFHNKQYENWVKLIEENLNKKDKK